MRFFYYYPTWKKPSGGNKQIRLMASLLRELGVETFLLRDRKFFTPADTFEDDVFYSVPIASAPFAFEDAGSHLSPEDVLILPEVILNDSLPLAEPWKCRIGLFNQNGFYALRYRPTGRGSAERIEFAMAISPYAASICRDFLGIAGERIFCIPPLVVRSPFTMQEAQREKALAVCYMPRKLPREVEQIRDLVRSTHSDVPWVEIDGIPADRVAEILRASAIFLSAQDLEGCPLTALEAMTCGCLVAGFAGTARFPHPYAAASNGLWVPDRNVQAAAGAVRSAIEIVKEGGARYRRFLEAGYETAGRYSDQAVRRGLSEVVEVVGQGSYSTRPADVPGLAWPVRAYAYWLLYQYDQLGAAGRFLSAVSRATKPLRRAFGSERD